METKPLLYGIIGFLLGGLLVSIAAVTIEKSPDNTATTTPSTSTMSMVDSLQGKTGDDFDKAFIAGMIAHHQDAIAMSKLSDKQAEHQEIKDLSQEIIQAQQQEIDKMKAWQQQWNYTQSASHENM